MIWNNEQSFVSTKKTSFLLIIIKGYAYQNENERKKNNIPYNRQCRIYTQNEHIIRQRK